MFLELFNQIFNFLKNNYLWYKTKFSNNQLYEYNFFSPNKLDLDFPKLILIENEKETLDISEYIPIFNIHNNSELIGSNVYFLEKLFNFKGITKINMLDSNNNLKVIEI